MPSTRFDHGTRRIALCGLTTVSAVVLLFSYRTSTSAEVPAEAGSADTPGTPDARAVASGRADPDADAPYGAGSGVAAPEARGSEGGGSESGGPESGGPESGSVDPRVAAAAAGPTVGNAAAGPTVGNAPSSRAWSGTVTGPVVRIQWGEVQVRATIAGGRITAVDVLRTPDENARDQQVNARAVPLLVRETLAAQSTQIDMVSGATYTSTGYVQSLQAALDQTGVA